MLRIDGHELEMERHFLAQTKIDNYIKIFFDIFYMCQKHFFPSRKHSILKININKYLNIVITPTMSQSTTVSGDNNNKTAEENALPESHSSLPYINSVARVTTETGIATHGDGVEHGALANAVSNKVIPTEFASKKQYKKHLKQQIVHEKKRAKIPNHGNSQCITNTEMHTSPKKDPNLHLDAVTMRQHGNGKNRHISSTCHQHSCQNRATTISSSSYYKTGVFYTSPSLSFWNHRAMSAHMAEWQRKNIHLFDVDSSLEGPPLPVTLENIEAARAAAAAAAAESACVGSASSARNPDNDSSTGCREPQNTSEETDSPTSPTSGTCSGEKSDEPPAVDADAATTETVVEKQTIKPVALPVEPAYVGELCPPGGYTDAPMDPEQFKSVVNRYMRCIHCLNSFSQHLESSEAMLLRYYYPNEKVQYCFAQFFSPRLIDFCVQKGLFPMAGDPFGGKRYVFFAKLDAKRGVVLLNNLSREQPSSSAVQEEPYGLIAQLMVLSPPPSPMGVRLPKLANKLIDRYSLAVDWFWDEAVNMIVARHGDNWLCRPLRAAFKFMFLHPELFKTKLHCVVLIDDQEVNRAMLKLAAEYCCSNREASDLIGYLGEHLPLVYSKAIVAAELGYTCRDTYTSLTGAFDRGGEHQGAGAVQLAALCAQLWRAGYRIWDTGQHMEYKQKMFHISGHTQEEWLVCNLFHSQMECISPFPSPLPPVVRRFSAAGNNEVDSSRDISKTLSQQHVVQGESMVEWCPAAAAISQPAAGEVHHGLQHLAPLSRATPAPLPVRFILDSFYGKTA